MAQPRIQRVAKEADRPDPARLVLSGVLGLAIGLSSSLLLQADGEEGDGGDISVPFTNTTEPTAHAAATDSHKTRPRRPRKHRRTKAAAPTGTDGGTDSGVGTDASALTAQLQPIRDGGAADGGAANIAAAPKAPAPVADALSAQASAAEPGAAATQDQTPPAKVAVVPEQPPRPHAGTNPQPPPVTEKPVTEKPVAEKPVAKKRAATGSSGQAAPEPPTKRPTATAKLEFKRGHVAYLRCAGVQRRDRRFPCPRDKTMERHVWSALAGLTKCSAASLSAGRGDIRLTFKRRLPPEIEYRALKQGLPPAAVAKCAGEALSQVHTRLYSLQMIVLFRFELRAGEAP